MLNTDTIHITTNLLALIAEIDEFKGAWRALGTLAPERLQALRQVATIESSKEDYYLALRQTQVTIRTEAPDWQPWLLFFCVTLHQQKRRLAAKVEREKMVLSALPEVAARMIEHARQHGRITIGEMFRSTGTNRNTLKEHFRKLVRQGHLKRHGSGKGSWYALH